QVFIVGLVYALIRIFSGRERPGGRGAGPWIFVAALCFAAQLYASFYLAWYLAFGLALAALVALVSGSTRGPLLAVLRARWRALLAAAALVVLAALPLVLHALRAIREVGMRGRDEVNLTIPDFRSWVYLGPFSWLWGWQPRLLLFHGIPLEEVH